jgi:poly(hydroxyalkanoate) depolymerase family esterase
MDWSDGMGAVRRGLGIATRVAAARLREYAPSPAARARSARATSARAAPTSGHFAVLGDVGSNPGNLRARVYLPPVPVRPGAPLVVLLHGCGQDVETFAIETGWTALADRLGLPLLLPEQQQANNCQRCFQWFQPDEIRRGEGEAASIAALVSAASSRFRSDTGKVFVAGLSAGGAMAAALLAAYPDVFAAGAVFAGLPVGTASTAVQALARMAHGSPDFTEPEWLDRAHRVAPSGYTGPWPRLSVWHGAADQVVVPDNGRKLAAQWRALRGLADKPTYETPQHSKWGNAVELWTLPGLGHAWAIGPGVGHPSQYAVLGPVDAVSEIARFWGIG